MQYAIRSTHTNLDLGRHRQRLHLIAQAKQSLLKREKWTPAPETIEECTPPIKS